MSGESNSCCCNRENVCDCPSPKCNCPRSRPPEFCNCPKVECKCPGPRCSCPRPRCSCPRPRCSCPRPRCSCPRPKRLCKCRPQRRCYCPCPSELGGIGGQLRVANNVYLNDGQSVIFDIITHRSTRDITYNPNSGKFCLREGKTYLISWDVAVEGSYHRPFVRFSLIADSNVISSSTIPVTVGQISGTGLLTVVKAPIEVSLINDTDDTVQLSSFSPVANITIVQVFNTTK